MTTRREAKRMSSCIDTSSPSRPDARQVTHRDEGVGRAPLGRRPRPVVDSTAPCGTLNRSKGVDLRDGE